MPKESQENTPYKCELLYLTAQWCAGLISAVPVGKKGDKGTLQVAAQQVEAMVKAKMGKPEYTILCLEDNSDWTNATTRRLVMAVRPLLKLSLTFLTPARLRL